ncbi:hypothetical protein A167_00645 [Alcanivorax sp. S71-1-4]|jgi:hypothetical protein|uniref:hypothetical protein n=1 Tax=Alcanivorax sp. S71-1-4 TaxID=1177159 RepID=UPI00135910A7|nr:hypothetical protein [Alcanivorax sp. S71-1-4]KAF0810766.1 hypothetical protein A167_00645 [Alcanivorax sp. S71-1-4]
MNSVNPNTAHTRPTLRRSPLLRALAALLMVLSLHLMPPAASVAQADNASIQAMQQEEAERAERRRPIMILFPAGAALITLILVLTIKRRK